MKRFSTDGSRRVCSWRSWRGACRAAGKSKRSWYISASVLCAVARRANLLVDPLAGANGIRSSHSRHSAVTCGPRGEVQGGERASLSRAGRYAPSISGYRWAASSQTAVSSMDQQITDLTGIAVVASVAVIVGLALIRLRQPAIVGYILAGVLLGPSGLALISRTEGLITLAELGVLMLLFLIAMELSIRAFVTVLRTALLCALLQIGVALGLTFLLALLMNWPVKTAVLLGFVVSLSSTAVAVKILEDIGELRTHVGRITVGVLIAQDLAVVPMLIVAGAMAGEGRFTYVVGIKVAVSVALLAALIWYLSRRRRVGLPIQRLMRGKADVIPLAALAFCFAAAAVSASIGLSAAYGAFLAGLLIGNSAVRAVTLRATLPIQSVLMVVFFLSIGLLLDLATCGRSCQPCWPCWSRLSWLRRSATSRVSACSASRGSAPFPPAS